MSRCLLSCSPSGTGLSYEDWVVGAGSPAVNREREERPAATALFSGRRGGAIGQDMDGTSTLDMNPAPTHGGVRILARLPATFGEIGIRSTHVGPSGRCVVVYDRAAWDAWDAACWDAQGHYVGAADPETRYPDPVMDCMRGGPGALAAWQGAEAEALVGWLADQDEELLVRVHWAAFCREADDETSALWADVAGAVAAAEFSGFGDLYRREPRWRGWIHSRAAGSAAMPGWTLASGLSRIRHLPIVLGVLDRLGVRVPQDLPIEADGLAATRQAASDLLSRRRHRPGGASGYRR